MADAINFSFKRIAKKLKTYEQANAKYAGTKAMRRIAFQIAKGKTWHSIPNTYKQIFKAPVSRTLGSLNYKAKGLTADLITNPDESKGNAPAKYLFPVIGGGSNEVFYTRFQEYLRGKGYMNNSDYAFANLKHPKIRVRGASGRVTPTTYRNTMIGLSQTKKGNLDFKSSGAKIQDGAVYAFKNDWSRMKKGGEKVTNKAGIWRMKVTKTEGSWLQPLFFFKDAPSVPNKGKLNTHVKEIFENIAPKIWIQEIKKAAK
tara:strand:+ start:985 stop:1758 length:774 start_codon:yes stop_codon:yes gene_type:complete